MSTALPSHPTHSRGWVPLFLPILLFLQDEYRSSFSSYSSYRMSTALPSHPTLPREGEYRSSFSSYSSYRMSTALPSHPTLPREGEYRSSFSSYSSFRVSSVTPSHPTHRRGWFASFLLIIRLLEGDILFYYSSKKASSDVTTFPRWWIHLLKSVSRGDCEGENSSDFFSNDVKELGLV